MAKRKVSGASNDTYGVDMPKIVSTPGGTKNYPGQFDPKLAGEYVTDEEIDHLCLHRKVEQDPKTIYKVHTIDWNNVPKVVYDAICHCIVNFDHEKHVRDNQLSEQREENIHLRKKILELEANLSDTKTFLESKIAMARIETIAKVNEGDQENAKNISRS